MTAAPRAAPRLAPCRGLPFPPLPAGLPACWDGCLHPQHPALLPASGPFRRAPRQPQGACFPLHPKTVSLSTPTAQPSPPPRVPVPTPLGCSLLPPQPCTPPGLPLPMPQTCWGASCTGLCTNPCCPQGSHPAEGNPLHGMAAAGSGGGVAVSGCLVATSGPCWATRMGRRWQHAHFVTAFVLQVQQRQSHDTPSRKGKVAAKPAGAQVLPHSCGACSRLLRSRARGAC